MSVEHRALLTSQPAVLTIPGLTAEPGKPWWRSFMIPYPPDVVPTGCPDWDDEPLDDDDEDDDD